MKEAAQTDIDYIGGVDAYNVDGQIEKTMDFTVQLALDRNKGIDIHLHETGESGLKTVEYLINKVNENPVLKGKTFLSHCFVLAKLDKPKQEEIAEKLANAKIGIMSTIPFGGLIMPIPTLYKYGVNIGTGNDSIIDHWNTWGSGSVLQKANLMAQLYGYSTEFLLSRSLKLATYNILPLDDKGTQQWPKSGDAADVVLIDASCSAEAVSVISPVKSLDPSGKCCFLVISKIKYMRVILFLLSFGILSNCHSQVREDKVESTSVNIIDAVKNNQPVLVEKALKEGANVNTKDSNKRSLLLIATISGATDTAKLLVHYGADVNQQDDKLDSPFLYAGATGQTELVKLYLAHGARFDIFNRYYGTALIPASERGHVETVRLLANTKDFPVNHVNRLGWTALMEAVILGNGGTKHQKTVQILKDAGADLNIPDHDGRTPLQHAKSLGFKEIVKILES